MDSYAALALGWSPNSMRPGAVQEELAQIAADPAAFLRSLVDREASLRQAYYFGSYRLVKSLIERGGLAKFLQLYAAADPDAAFVELYGVPRAQLVDALE